MKCIIIDDEPKARKLLQAVIETYCNDLSIEALCEDLPSGIKAIKKHKPQLIFLDIEMPGHSGLELLDFFDDDEVNFNIIFTTAYNEYALQAFKLSAIDYLLKPIQHTQLVDAVQRFIKKEEQHQTQKLKVLKENLNSSTSWESKKIIVPSGQSLHFFNPSDIVMIKGEAAYSDIYFKDGSKLLASRNLKHFEDLLAEIPLFLRTHKSYIVNINYIKQYVKSDGGYLQLINNCTAGISPERVDELMKKIN
ncbi:MAG: LytR/AlgR family response regulator transcription factor [Chitinophagaceae bacterium]